MSFSKNVFFAAFLNLHLKDFPIPLPVILFLIGCSFEILSFTSDKVCILNISILCYTSDSYKFKDGLRKYVKTTCQFTVLPVDRCLWYGYHQIRYVKKGTRNRRAEIQPNIVKTEPLSGRRWATQRMSAHTATESVSS